MRACAVLGVGLALAMLMAVNAGASQVDLYNDKDAWSQACGGLYQTEAFDDDQLNPGVSYSSSSSGNISNGFYHDVLQSGNPNTPSTTWSFTPQLTGYGGNWTLGGPGGSGPNLLVYLNGSHYVGAISNQYDGGFWGFISDTPFTSVLLIGGAGDHQQNYKLDNMVYCQVPLPGSVLLLGGGLAGFLGRRRFWV